MTVASNGSSDATGLRFTQVALRNWRNFVRVDDLELSNRVFVVGPNASGKSNFLDCFRFLRDVASEGGGLHVSVGRIRGGTRSLRCMNARKGPGVAIEVHVGTDESPTAWTYLLEFDDDAQGRPVVLRERVVRDGQVLINRPDPDDRVDDERLLQTSLQQVTANKDFRDLVALFRSIHYVHLVPQLVREPERYKGERDDPFGGDFLERVAQTDKRVSKARLRKIAGVLRSAVPQMLDLVQKRDDEGNPHLYAKYETWRPKGAWQTEKQLSDGSLRLIGMLWAILDGGGPLLLEEPELSLHPKVIRALPGLFARAGSKASRQVLVSSHSADLLADEGIGLDEVLVLQPSSEGTEIRSCARIDEVRRLLESGVPLAEAVLPHSAPTGTVQLALFDE